MADDQNIGRARGRARGRAVTSEELKAILAARRPGEAIGGRGMGAAPNVPTSGRAYHRGSGSRPGEEGSSSGSLLSSLKISSTDSSSLAGSVEAAVSIGRGATRGKRDRSDMFKFIRTRPETLTSKKGDDGNAITVSSNYFAMIQKPNWRLLQYRVDFNPPIEMTKVKKALLYKHKDTLPKFMFDGSLMFTTSKLSENDSNVVLTTMLEREKTDVTITIRLVGEIQPTDAHYIQFFNIVLRSAMEKLQLELIKRDYFDPKAAVKLNQYKLELWPGYVTSIRQHEDKILLCCEIGNKILRTDTVLDQMEEIIKRAGASSSFRSIVEKSLLGAIVITRYNNKTYRIDEIAWDKHPADEFDGRNGEKMSYVKYYAQKYNKSIRDQKQPLLVSLPKIRDERSGESGPIYLVPELCFMTGLSEEQRANFQLMKALGDYTRQDPKRRTESLMKFSDRINTHPEIKKELASWNLEFSKDLETFKARTLQPETILGSGSSKATYKLDNADWGSCFRKWSSYSSKNLTKWAVIHSSRDEAVTKEFVTSLNKVTPSLGMKLSAPKTISLPDNKPSTYLAALDKILEMSPQLVMVVVPNNKGDHYATIKKKCYVEKAVPSQIVTASVLSKPKGLMSVATKVAIQMNTKLGGEPWAVKMPMTDTMVIGYDTYHDTVQKGRSVGAIVASMNSSMTKYISIANLHSNPHQELNDNMVPAISKALRKYQEINSNLPSRIIIYRDGVGDGQIQYVIDHEIAAILSCLAKAGLPEDQVKFTYIVVNKKINTRIMQMEGRNAVNPPSGTVVDDVVTLPERYDFFLVSQSVRQGTVNPTSYNVIKDNSGLKPGHLQRLTYKLTHLYYNWPGTVRVPAPCQYAHKLAFLVGESLHHQPSEKLEDTLFYL